MKLRDTSTWAALLLGLGFGVGLGKRRRRGRYRFQGRSVVITGGSRGLGFVLARRLRAEGALLTLLARDMDELDRARSLLAPDDGGVLCVSCDLRNREEVDRAIQKAAQQFHGVDVLINNAGIIQVGPLEHMTVQDFEDALAIHLYAPLFCTLAVLPHMRRRGEGRIVNIASVGGKIAVPHLLPYSASKFALVGLSEGLRVELRRHNIFVTTVCPGLMRTGSPRNALFKGRHEREYAWFAISDSLPLLSMDAETAAEKILRACRHGAARLILGAHIKGAVLFNEIFPGASAAALNLANRFLPGPGPTSDTQARPGYESHSIWAPSWLTRSSERAAAAHNELIHAQGQAIL